MTEENFIVKVLQDCVSSMVILGLSSPNFDAGRSLDILGNLSQKDQSTSLKDSKYPLIAVQLPIIQYSGIGLKKIRIPRIVIATLTTGDDFLPVVERFDDGQTFELTLRPLYREFLRQISRSRWFAVNDPDTIVHTFFCSPGQQPIGKGLSDYVDIIEILNMELFLNNIQNCN